MKATPHSLREAAQRLEGLAYVVGYDLLEDNGAIELTVGPGLDRVPPTVVRILGQEDLGIVDAKPRPEGYYVVLAR